MKRLFIALLATAGHFAFAQYDFAPSAEYPYGRPNPNDPVQIKDYGKLIGASRCKSFSKKPDGTWDDLVDMIWTFKYIMNGMGVQDHTLKSDGSHSGSIRQYSTDSSRWYVHYYTNRRYLAGKAI